MPELPDIALYVDRLAERIVDRRLVRACILKPFLLRTVDPPLSGAEGRCVTDVRQSERHRNIADSYLQAIRAQG
jgi:formamidopyrimidine-DNA glycosylase